MTRPPPLLPFSNKDTSPATANMLASPKRQFALPQLPSSMISLSPTQQIHRQPSEYELAMLDSINVNPSNTNNPATAYAPGFGQHSQFINQRYISGRGGGNPVTERKNAVRALERQARDIVSELQFLVTSQERALKPGSNNSNNMGGSMMRRKKVLTVRQARDGILDAMQSLLDVKEAEESFYAEDVAVREGLVAQVGKWVEKRGKLEKEVERIEGGKEGREMEELRGRVEGIQVEINSHEESLKKLRSQQTDLLKQISTIQTTLAARASSYNSAIQSLHRTATNFLQSPSSLLPVQNPKTTVPLTPDAAVDYWNTENKALKEKRDAAKEEAAALRDGLVVWDECVGMIDRFETAMAKELADVVEKNTAASRNLVDLNESEVLTPTARRSMDHSTPGSSSGRSTPTSSFANRIPRQGMAASSHSRNGSLTSSGSTFKATTAGRSSHMPEEVAVKLVRGIDKTIGKLEANLNVAEDRGWTLLVCCIGAELDSFREAREALIANTGIEPPSPTRPKGKEKATTVGENLIPTSETDSVSSPELPMKDPKMQHAGTWETSDAESEIDDPEALFSNAHSYITTVTATKDDDVQHMSLPSPRVRQIQDELEYAAFASSSNIGGSGSTVSASSTFVRRIPADVTYRRPSSVTGGSSSPRKGISPPPPGMRIDPDVLDSPHSAFPPNITSDVLGSEHSAFPQRRNSADAGKESTSGGFGEGSDSTVRRGVTEAAAGNDDVD